MKQVDVFIISIIIIGSLQTTYAQTDETNMLLEVSDEEKIILFASFAIAIIAIFLFLARDIILRKKSSYDNEEFESKEDRTYEKYHSDWGDDYEEIGTRKNTKEDREFRNAAIAKLAKSIIFSSSETSSSISVSSVCAYVVCNDPIIIIEIIKTSSCFNFLLPMLI